MRADEFIDETLEEAARAWKKSKKGGAKLRFRCPAGPRKGRIVSKPSDCYAAPNPAKAAKMRVTRKRTGARQARRARFTKRVNPYAKLMRQLNKKLR